MNLQAQCWQCEKTMETERLVKCPICHKHFCEEHGYSMSGRPFCSQGCAQYFFFSDDESDTGGEE